MDELTTRGGLQCVALQRVFVVNEWLFLVDYSHPLSPFPSVRFSLSLYPIPSLHSQKEAP